MEILFVVGFVVVSLILLALAIAVIFDVFGGAKRADAALRQEQAIAKQQQESERQIA